MKQKTVYFELLTFYIVKIITTLWIEKKKIQNRRDYMYGCIRILIVLLAVLLLNQWLIYHFYCRKSNTTEKIPFSILASFDALQYYMK